MARNFRTIFKSLTPGWLHEGDGEKVLFALALMTDAAWERLRQGLLARFPAHTSATCNALTGRDRGIIRGRSETDEHYAARLVAWRYPRGHRTRGNAFALLEQIWEYWGGAPCYTIDVRGNRFDRDLDGVESYSAGQAWNWDGAPPAPRWARFWAVLDLSGIASAWADTNFSNPDLWGGTFGEPGYTIGIEGITEHDVRAIEGLFRGLRPWKPAGTRAEWLIVSLDGSEPAPDGTWLNWSKNVAGEQVPTRDRAFRYVSLTPLRNNTYSGDPDNFPANTEAVGGHSYDGDPDSFPASATLPSGAVYAGDPSKFPVNVLLLDDGDLPA